MKYFNYEYSLIYFSSLDIIERKNHDGGRNKIFLFNDKSFIKFPVAKIFRVNFIYS
jgi:hypothetical protein